MFDEHFRRFAGHVYAYALRRTNAGKAEDVTAETFLVAWRRRDDAPSEPLPWLYGIARRVLANERRATNRQDALNARVAAQPTALGSPLEDDSRVLEAVATLGASDQEILLLITWENLSTNEAATVLGCSSAAAAVRLHRARRRLARALDDTIALPRQTISEVST